MLGCKPHRATSIADVQDDNYIARYFYFMYNFVHVYLHEFTETCSSVFKNVIFNIWKCLNRDVICLQLYVCMLETAEEFVWMKMIH